MVTDKSKATRGLKGSNRLGETDLANDRMGKNSLQGNDQVSVRNERHADPDARLKPDEMMESFEKMDKDKRAKSDLGKGNRSGK
jgi:hypothetical protein